MVKVKEEVKRMRRKVKWNEERVIEGGLTLAQKREWRRLIGRECEEV